SLVHEGGVVVPDLAGFAARGAGGGGLLDQVGGALRREFGESGASAPGTAVGRYLHRVQPGAVGIAEEVIPRCDALVDTGKIQCRRCGGCGSGGGRGRERADRESGAEQRQRESWTILMS